MKIIDLAFQGPHEFQSFDDKYRLQLEQSRAWSKALVVPETHPAKEVAEIVGLNDMDIVVVIDKHNVVKGVVAPKIIVNRVTQFLPNAIRPKDFLDAVSEIAKYQKQDKAGFEWLNLNRPELHWCAKGNHRTTKDPCPDHEK